MPRVRTIWCDTCKSYERTEIKLGGILCAKCRRLLPAQNFSKASLVYYIRREGSHGKAFLAKQCACSHAIRAHILILKQNYSGHVRPEVLSCERRKCRCQHFTQDNLEFIKNLSEARNGNV